MLPGEPSRYAGFGVRPNIRDMSHLFGPDHLTKTAFRMRSPRPRREFIGVGRGHVVKRCPPSDVPLNKVHRAEIGPANSRRVLQQALKHWLKVARRTANDFENL